MEWIAARPPPYKFGGWIWAVLLNGWPSSERNERNLKAYKGSGKKLKDFLAPRYNINCFIYALKYNIKY